MPDLRLPLQSLTAGHLLDVIQRTLSCIEEEPSERPWVDEHAPLVGELRAIEFLLRREIGASHMGIGAEHVLLETPEAHRAADPHCTCNDCIDWARTDGSEEDPGASPCVCVYCNGRKVTGGIGFPRRDGSGLDVEPSVPTGVCCHIGEWAEAMRGARA